MMCGGWSDFRSVTSEEVKLFEKSVEGLKGVDYTPLIVATQIAAGENYKFICNAKAVTIPPRKYLAEIIIRKNLATDDSTGSAIMAVIELE